MIGVAQNVSSIFDRLFEGNSSKHKEPSTTHRRNRNRGIGEIAWTPKSANSIELECNGKAVDISNLVSGIEPHEIQWKPPSPPADQQHETIKDKRAYPDLSSIFKEEQSNQRNSSPLLQRVYVPDNVKEQESLFPSAKELLLTPEIDDDNSIFREAWFTPLRRDKSRVSLCDSMTYSFCWGDEDTLDDIEIEEETDEEQKQQGVEESALEASLSNYADIFEESTSNEELFQKSSRTDLLELQKGISCGSCVETAAGTFSVMDGMKSYTSTTTNTTTTYDHDRTEERTAAAAAATATTTTTSSSSSSLPVSHAKFDWNFFKARRIKPKETVLKTFDEKCEERYPIFTELTQLQRGVSCGSHVETVAGSICLSHADDITLSARSVGGSVSSRNRRKTSRHALAWE